MASKRFLILLKKNFFLFILGCNREGWRPGNVQGWGGGEVHHMEL